MNYLAACQRLVAEAGIANGGPSTVTGQTGQLARVVNWIAAAYGMILSERDDWSFMWTTDSFNTLADGTATYDRSSANLRTPDKDTFAIYLAATGTSVRQRLPFENYPLFREHKKTAPASDTQPTKITQRPDGSLEVWPGPNAVYTVEYELYRVANTLSDDSDAFLLPTDYHMMVVYKALMLPYARYENQHEIVPYAQTEYKTLHDQLLREQTGRSLWSDDMRVIPE